MKQVTLKPNKHVLLLQVDASISDQQREDILQRLDESFPELNVMISSSTEITLLTLED